MTGPRMISMTGLEATGLITLGDLLANFMGAKYRKTMVNWKQVYLSIAAYGEAEGLAQTHLEQRYQDHQRIWYWEPWSTDYYHLYPDPRNDDGDWYLKAEEITRGLEKELESRNGVKFGNDLDNFVKTISISNVRRIQCGRASENGLRW